MRKPSRQMPPAPTRTTPLGGWLIVGILGTCLLSLVWLFPIVLALIVLIAFVNVHLTIARSCRLGRLAAGRQGESICTFARSFDRRTVDTWIIRAAFEELQPYCRFGRRTLPLRATDDLDGVLQIDPKDLDDLAADIAYRAGRSMGETAQNPLCENVRTVADLVIFFTHQPVRTFVRIW
ncbi:MAG TPA: hypothetical protein VGH33_11605 [Isosphaeraceae bacterium]|jgi:hypothetical protein